MESTPIGREASQEDEVHLIRKALARLMRDGRLSASQSESLQCSLAEALSQAASDRARLLRLLEAVLVAVDEQLLSSSDVVSLKGGLVALYWSRLFTVLRQDAALEGISDVQIRSAFKAAANDPSTGVSGYQVRVTFGPGDRRRALVMDLEAIRSAVGRFSVPLR